MYISRHNTRSIHLQHSRSHRWMGWMKLELIKSGPDVSVTYIQHAMSYFPLFVPVIVCHCGRNNKWKNRQYNCFPVSIVIHLFYSENANKSLRALFIDQIYRRMLIWFEIVPRVTVSGRQENSLSMEQCWTSEYEYEIYLVYWIFIFRG